MFWITVQDHIMIAHSLTGPAFGPAQRRHGATYVVEATLRRDGLNADGIVADLGLLAALLHEVLAPLNYRDLDEVPELAGLNTTTEVLARHIADRIADRVHEGALGTDGLGITAIEVLLRENPLAAAGYERAL